MFDITSWSFVQKYLQSKRILRQCSHSSRHCQDREKNIMTQCFMPAIVLSYEYLKHPKAHGAKGGYWLSFASPTTKKFQICSVGGYPLLLNALFRISVNTVNNHVRFYFRNLRRLTTNCFSKSFYALAIFEPFLIEFSKNSIKILC